MGACWVVMVITCGAAGVRATKRRARLILRTGAALAI
jgi:hypothetical protein